jgi:hypothetical protein
LDSVISTAIGGVRELIKEDSKIKGDNNGDN